MEAHQGSILNRQDHNEENNPLEILILRREDKRGKEQGQMFLAKPNAGIVEDGALTC